MRLRAQKQTEEFTRHEKKRGQVDLARLFGATICVFRDSGGGAC